ncbi:mitochondrial genome maintenance exonuclease 1 [Lepeophtheirus salmonis]|uniref:mitochondrial genome maintenance exonuclease 1 n=1 Tax=Lepeophtheirus salmonis TaxID=72036 RepID=UPI001AE67A18|nr:mitochondrial genome maintenance exonuclease 1-like [Lepeophtheirus salmonis]
MNTLRNMFKKHAINKMNLLSLFSHQSRNFNSSPGLWCNWKNSSNYYNNVTNKLLYGPARRVKSKTRIAKTMEKPNSEKYYTELQTCSTSSQTLWDDTFGPVIQDKDNNSSIELSSTESNGVLEGDNATLYNYKKDFPPSNYDKDVIKCRRKLGSPSVTKILDSSMSADKRTALFFWEQKMIQELGIAGFSKYKTALLQRGSRFHTLIYEHFRGVRNLEGEIPFQGTEDPIVVNQIQSVQHVIGQFDSPIALESAVYHSLENYMGIIDFFGRFNPTGEYVVVDWKTSDKKKDTLQKTFDNPVQVAAYFGAINYDSNYTVKPHSGLIVIAYNDGTPANILKMSNNALEYYWREWKIRLHIHRKMIS